MIGSGVAALVSTTALQQKGTASAAPSSGGKDADFADTLGRIWSNGQRSGDASADTEMPPKDEPQQAVAGHARRDRLLADVDWRGPTQDGTVEAKDADSADADGEPNADDGLSKAGEKASALPDGNRQTMVPVDVVTDTAAAPDAKIAESTDGEESVASTDTLAEAEADTGNTDVPPAFGKRKAVPSDDAQPLPPATPQPVIDRKADSRTDQPTDDQTPTPPVVEPDRSNPVATAPAAANAMQATVSNEQVTAAGRAAPVSGNGGRDAADGKIASSAPEAPGSGMSSSDDVIASTRAETSPAPSTSSAVRTEVPISRPIAPQTQNARSGETAPSVVAEVPAREKPAAAEPGETRARSGEQSVPRVSVAASSTAQPSTPDKPATIPIVQSAQPLATGSERPASAQVADAVARDLEELAPSRLVVATASGQGRAVRTISLQLNPVELGSVNIRLHHADGEMRVSIRAESDQTAQMLARDSDAIRSALRAAGIQASEISVTTNRPDTAAQQQLAGQNRDASGQQWSGHDNRGNTSNESGQSNRQRSSGDLPDGRPGRDGGDAGAAVTDDRLLI